MGRRMSLQRCVGFHMGIFFSSNLLNFASPGGDDLMSYFLNTFPVYFFRGYGRLFSFLSHFYSVRSQWNKCVCFIRN